MAARAGVRVDTVRYYERRGLLRAVARTPSGYRSFTPADVERIRFTKQAQALGFTLDEIADILENIDRGGTDYARAHQRIARVLARTDEKLAELRAVRRTLAAMLRRYSGDGCSALEEAARRIRGR